jgi:hypothetical protein
LGEIPLEEGRDELPPPLGAVGDRPCEVGAREPAAKPESLAIVDLVQIEAGQPVIGDATREGLGRGPTTATTGKRFSRRSTSARWRGRSILRMPILEI